MPEKSKCRSCGAPILWVTMQKTGKKNPLDFEPVENGNVLIEDDPKGVLEKTGRVLSGDELVVKHEEGELLHISHFATCPQSKSHRKPA